MMRTFESCTPSSALPSKTLGKELIPITSMPVLPSSNAFEKDCSADFRQGSSESNVATVALQLQPYGSVAQSSMVFIPEHGILKGRSGTRASPCS